MAYLTDDNGVIRELTAEEIAELNNSEPMQPSYEERIAELEALLNKALLGAE